MSTRQIIQTLVERFAEQSERYRQPDYNEAQTRADFITPFFQALAWDVQNQQGVAENYRPVVLEHPLRYGHVTKIPDYSFRMGGARKFFVEAKKPAVNLKTEAEPALQVRRYGWNAKLSLSIVTNFAEFAVYDCRLQPHRTDKAATARLWYLRYTDYVKNWDKLVEYFSFDAVWQGSLEKYLMQQATPKGILTVDAAFLNEIENWREDLAHDIIKLNAHLTSRQINFAVQQTIDRIIFLRICEDRGIEDYGKLLNLTHDTQIYPRLFQLFYQADARYNSGLFHFKAESARDTPDQLTPKLRIDDAILTKMLKNLYYPDSPYEFSVFPADILGQVYEQFLGKVIRLTEARQAVVEEKPEVKKAGGVYYTPTYIVDYIVKKTLGQLVAGKTVQQISQLKILDPACGSGSFLLEVYEFLLAWHLENYLKDKEKWSKGKQPCLYQATGGGWKLTITERKRILLNNIYGVDIDTQAVEVTKLSLLLKVLEDEQSVISQLSLIRERVLPDLENNIKCGNSLISNDFYLGQSGLLDEETLYRVNAFDWKQEFAEIMHAGGFDAVLGNPPYGAEFSELTLNYLKQRFTTFVWRGESYLLFVEQAQQLLKLNGWFGCIIPDTYLNLGFTRSLRNLLLQQTELHEIVLLPAKVFNAATVDTTLLFTQKMQRTDTFHEKLVTVNLFNKKIKLLSLIEPDRSFSVSTKSWYEQDAFLIQSDLQQTELVWKIENGKAKIGDFAKLFYGIKAYQVGKGKPPQSKKIVSTKPFTATRQENAEFLPFCDGKHIGRYQLLWNKNNWLHYGKWLAEPRPTTTFEGEKILIRKIISSTLIATYLTETYYCNTLLYVLKINEDVELSYPYLLGILNSRLIGWYFKKKFQINAMDTFPQIMIRDIIQFPIAIAAPAPQQHLTQLVMQLLELYQRLAAMKELHGQKVLQRQIVAVDAAIDKMVYELYDLTPDEIEIIEKNE